MAQISEDATAARELGLKTFISDKPCRVCDGIERFSSHGAHCVSCARRILKKNREVKRMAKERRFEINSEEVGDWRRNVNRFHCATCDNKDSLTIANSKGALPSSVVAKKMRQKGWDLGKDDDSDRCPVCVSRERIDSRKAISLRRLAKFPEPLIALENTSMDAHNQTTGNLTVTSALAHLPSTAALPICDMPPPRAETPREPTKLERRTIFLKIEDVYEDERIGYSNGWNDQRVADDLNTRRAWVRSIREENFGIEKPAIDFGALKTELTAMADKANGLYASAEEMVDRATGLSMEVVKLRGEAEGRFRDAGLVVDQMVAFGEKLAGLEAR